MCSIVGGVVNQRVRDNPSSRRWLDGVFHASADRGSDAFGFNAWSRQGVGLMDRQRFKKSIAEVDHQFPVQPFTFLATMRGEPTTEWHGATTLEDIQPFTCGAWTVAHNGTIANDQELRDECASTSVQQIPTQVDSWVIAYVLSRYGFERGIKKLKGSFAFLAFNEEEPHKMYYATNYKPLYLLGHPEGDHYFFASQERYFDSLPQDPLHTASPVQIQPYTYGWLNLLEGTLVGDSLLPLIETQPRALIVCSGGLDSSVAAWMYHKQDYHVDLLHLAYECRAQTQELTAVYDLSTALIADGNPGGHVTVLQTDFFSRHATSTLTTPGTPIAQGESGAEFAHEWVPARNTVMLALATAFAEKHGYHMIVLGSNQEESCGGYPDNEQEFINKWRALLPYAVKPYTQLEIDDPLGGSMKHEIVTTGHHWDAPMELSWSCYDGEYLFEDGNGEPPTGIVHCGTCGPCTMRRRAFKMAGVKDLTVYAEEGL